MLRRIALAVLYLASTTLGSAWAVAAGAHFELRTLPIEVFETPANPKEGLVGWVYFLIVESDSADTIVPVDLKLEYLASGRVVRDEYLHPEALSTIALSGIDPIRLTGEPMDTPTFWPHAFRIVAQVPAALKVDEVRAHLRFVAGQETRSLSKRIGVAGFKQKTRLIFPFVGEGLITQTGVLESGHRNRSGLHAIDALGLTGLDL